MIKLEIVEFRRLMKTRRRRLHIINLNAKKDILNIKIKRDR